MVRNYVLVVQTLCSLLNMLFQKSGYKKLPLDPEQLPHSENSSDAAERLTACVRSLLIGAHGA